jgi:hypothetical protein
LVIIADIYYLITPDNICVAPTTGDLFLCEDGSGTPEYVVGVNQRGELYRFAANAANGQQRTIGAVRVVLEPKPGLPTDPEDVEAFIDIFTDISGLFVINNESGWYEGWMIHDLRVPRVATPRADGSARFGTMTAADAAAIASIGNHHNNPGSLFTLDGKAVRRPSTEDSFPSQQSNLVPISLSMGAYNSCRRAIVTLTGNSTSIRTGYFPSTSCHSLAA